MYGESLLSKIIDTNDPLALKRFSIERYHFPTEVERQAYDFISDYAEKNRGNAPDYRTLVAEIENFNYLPDVEDSLEYLSERLKDHAGKRMLHEFLTSKEVSEKFSNMTAEEFTEWLTENTEQIKRQMHLNHKVGLDLKQDTDKFLLEYERRKIGKSFKIWQSKFPSVNNSIGGYFSGNIYTWYGRSGRGKSVFVMEEALEAACQGANVLVWALEMSSFEWFCRAYSSLSAREGKTNATIDGVDYEAGFENLQMLRGKLSLEFEEGLKQFLKELPEKVSGNITVRAVDDETFYRRDLKQLEQDILTKNADLVVLDPAYYIDMEANTSKTAGGDVANTSKKLRHIAGRTQTVIHVITQADEDKKEKRQDGTRELKAPERGEIKKSKQFLEDAVNVFGVDTLDGLGVIEIGKGRAGGEGDVIEVIYLPSYGIVRELKGEEEAKRFDTNF